MADISIGSVATAGLSLARRRPRTLLAWSGAYFLYSLVSSLPSLALVWQILPGLFNGSTSAEEFAAAANGPTATLINLLTLPVSVLVTVIIMTTIYRAILRPEESRGAYIRLGMDEMRCLGVLVVLLALFGIGLVGVALVIAGVAMAAGDARIPAIVVLGLAAAAGFYYFAVRLSFALPITLAERRFSLFDSWGLTKGRFWSLFGAYLLSGVIAIGILLAFYIVVIVLAVGGFFAGRDWLEQLADAGAWGTIAAMAVPLGVILAAVIVTLFTLVTVITTAPPAAAYRSLRRDHQATAETFA